MLNENIKRTISKIENKHSTDGVRVHGRTPTQTTLEDVLEGVREIGEKRDWIMKTILAVYLSTFIEPKSDPLWLMIVGNPSSNKTTLVNLIKGSTDTYAVDSLTANPFSSGQKETKKDKAKDLLPLIDNKCFIIKEYGTLLSKSDELVKSLIGDLTAIYDGEFVRHSPTRGTVEYNSFFSHIGCVTPMALNSRHKYMSSIGARFLFLKIPSLEEQEREKSLKAVWNSKKGSKQDLTLVVSQFCEDLKSKANTPVLFSEDTQNQINQFANLIARARGIVITERSKFVADDGFEKNYIEVVDIQVEEPFRALKQIKKMARCIALVNGKNEVGGEELEIVREIILSSMPPRRADVLKVFERGDIFTANKASQIVEKSQRTIKRNFDELVALNVLERVIRENQNAHEYTLRKEFKSIFPIEDVATPEYVESIFELNDSSKKNFRNLS